MTSSVRAEVVRVSLDRPFDDQKPGTSGLRKSSRQFQTPHYLESFIEAVLQVLPVEGGTLVVGGDGRFGNLHAIGVIARMAAAHGVARLVTTTGGILSTPAASHLIRTRGAIGGIILSASHNPGGPEGDFGVKVNGANGGPAPESVTNAIHQATLTLSGYSTVEAEPFPLDAPGQHRIGAMAVEVIDGVEDYVALMGQLFDFERIGQLLRGTSTWPLTPCTPSPVPMACGCSRACWERPPARCAMASRWRISAAAIPTRTSPMPMSWRPCCWRATPTTSGPPATAMETAT